MDMNKELKDFAVRFAGAFVGMEESAATEIYYRTHGNPTTFPYGNISPNIAPNDNLIVAGLSIPPWVIGYLLEEDAEKRGDMKTKEMGENLRKFGEGDVLYSVSLVLHDTLIRNVSNTQPLQARAGGQLPTQPIIQPRVAMTRTVGATGQEAENLHISDGEGSQKRSFSPTISIAM
jgi:hypothetical protein